MVRSILAALAGYVVLAGALFMLMTLAWLVLGADGAFRPGSYEVTGTWIVVSIVLSVAAAVLAGFVCKAIGKTGLSVNILVGIVLVLGVVSAFYEMGMEHMTTPRPDDIPMFEAMSNGIQPVWLSWLNPILGAIGVMYGGKLKGPVKEESAD
jgi:hypothetical protein